MKYHYHHKNSAVSLPSQNIAVHVYIGVGLVHVALYCISASIIVEMYCNAKINSDTITIFLRVAFKLLCPPSHTYLSVVINSCL